MNTFTGALATARIIGTVKWAVIGCIAVPFLLAAIGAQVYILRGEFFYWVGGCAVVAVLGTAGLTAYAVLGWFEHMLRVNVSIATNTPLQSN